MSNQNGLVEVAFEAPLYDSAKGLMGLMFMQIDKVTTLLKDPTFNPTDGRLELMVHHLISAFVSDYEEQKTLRKDLDTLIQELTSKATGNENKGIAKNRACLEFEGLVLSKQHDIFGTTKRNRVGFTWNPKECEVVDFR